MKTIIKYLIIVLLLFSFTIVKADNVNPNSIDINTYVIGRHEFTENMILTTRHIMLGARTIDSDKLEDMIIYYKSIDGSWIDGLSGDPVTVPTTFKINYIDLVDTLSIDTPNPVIINKRLDDSDNVISEYQSYSNGSLVYSMGNDDTLYRRNNQYIIDGYEICIVENGECVDVLASGVPGSSVNVKLNLGSSYDVAVRVFAKNDSNEFVYSDLGRTTHIVNEIMAPVLKKVVSDYSVGTYSYDISIDSENFATFSGYYLYEKTSNGDRLVSSNLGVNDSYTVQVTNNDKLQYYAKVYAFDKQLNPVLGKKSDILPIAVDDLPISNIFNPNAGNTELIASYSNNDYQVAPFVNYSDGHYTYQIGVDLTPFEVNNSYTVDGFIYCKSNLVEGENVDMNDIMIDCMDTENMLGSVALNNLGQGNEIVHLDATNEHEEMDYLSIAIDVPVGQKKNYRVMPFIARSDNRFNYYAASNILEIDTNIKKPTLIDVSEYSIPYLNDDGVYERQLSINPYDYIVCLPQNVVSSNNTLTCSNVTTLITSFKIYRSSAIVTTTQFNINTPGVLVTVYPGDTGSFTAKAFDNTVSSDSSVAYVYDFTNLRVPVLNKVTNIPAYDNGIYNYTVNIDYNHYRSYIENEDQYRYAYEYYKVFNADTDDLIVQSTNPGDNVIIPISVGTTKNIYAKVCAHNFDNEEVCSNASTVLSIDTSLIDPVLEITETDNLVNETYNYSIVFANINQYISNATNNETSISGFKIQVYDYINDTYVYVVGDQNSLEPVLNANGTSNNVFTYQIPNANFPNGVDPTRIKFRITIYAGTGLDAITKTVVYERQSFVVNIDNSNS